LLNVKEDAGTYFSSFHAFFYFIDDSVALLDCGVIGSEAKLVHHPHAPIWLANKSLKYF
jgi:hypothetical protein